MLSLEQVDTTDKKQVERFIDVPFHIYKDIPQWVPPIRLDVRDTLDRKKHPFYEHSTADFFIVMRDGRDVGRIAALENSNYNAAHDSRTGQFYFFDCEDDSEASAALFERVFEWAKGRKLDKVMGPKGFSPFDGYGMLERGFEHRQMMTMMTYNHPYLPRLLESMGFEKEVDFVSCYLNKDAFKLDERIHHIADRVQKRGSLRVLKFRNKRELVSWAPKIGRAYNNAFINNWEYCPLSDKEIDFIVDNIITIANPNLFKIIAHEDDVVGFLFAFPDVSAAIQRSKGRLLPFGLFDILLEMRRTTWVALNGAGILPEFQGRGGNALLYSEMEKTVRHEGFRFEHADMTQIAESAVQMRNDLDNLGGKAYKNHRVFRKSI